MPGVTTEVKVLFARSERDAGFAGRHAFLPDLPGTLTTLPVVTFHLFSHQTYIPGAD